MKFLSNLLISIGLLILTASCASLPDFPRLDTEAEVEKLKVDLLYSLPEAEQKAVFSGTVEKDTTHDLAGAGHYKDGEDAAVYEAAEAAVDFVRDNLTEDNLEAYDELLDNDPEAAVEFAMETIQEMAGDEDA